MRTLVVLWVVSSLGCGSSHGRDGEDAGHREDAGTRVDAFVERDAGPPDECRVDTTTSPPHATTLAFENDTGAELFLGEDCRLRFTVSSCASGYEPLALYADCTVPCPAPRGMGCLACGACAVRALPVAPGEVFELPWDGIRYAFESTGCTCSIAMNAPAGRYRVEIPVYDTATAAESNAEPVRAVQIDFELPSPAGRVTIPLGG
jgi:hypothetical protein